MTTSPAHIEVMGIALPKAQRSTGCLPSYWVRKPGTAKGKADRCTSPILIQETSAQMPSSAEVQLSQPGPRFQRSVWATEELPYVSSVTEHWARGCCMKR